MNTTLRDSVSNWIVGDSTPAGQDSLRQSGTFPAPALVKVPSTLEEMFAEKKIQKAKAEDSLGKRPYPFKGQDQTIDPAQIFSTIQSYTQPTVIEPLHKKQRQELTCSANAFLEELCESPEHLTSLFGSQSQAYEGEVPDVLTPNEEEEEEACAVSPTRGHPLNEVEIAAQISFGKRGNGNQPWQPCSVAPEKLGKMRRIAVELTTTSPESLAVRLRARICGHEERGHKSKLVLCSGDRCCTKTKVEGQRKPVIRCAERLAELELPEVQLSAEESITQDFFLKPEWNGLGANKSRPSFDMHVELVDCVSGQVHELLSWEVELQSHKFESSHKAKSSSQHSSTVLTSVCLDPQ